MSSFPMRRIIGAFVLVGSGFLAGFATFGIHAEADDEQPWTIINGPEDWSDIATICYAGNRYAMTKDDVQAASAIAIATSC